jgi:hypothetical protein
MADVTPRVRDDTPAAGAYAAHYRLTAGEAAVEWPSASEAEHKHWRRIAGARVSAVTAGQAVYERWHSLLRQRFPGIAPIAWDELDGEAHAEWEDIARAGFAAYIEANGGDPVDVATLGSVARLSAGLRDVQHACGRGDAPHVIASVAVAALADVDRLTAGNTGPHPDQALAGDEDRAGQAISPPRTAG